MSSKACLCAIAKDEGHDIAEWVLYHLFLGFAKVIVYDNDSSDDTRAQVERCAAYGDVTVRSWPQREGQLPAYAHCVRTDGSECDWMAFLDIDEFLVLPAHRNLGEFLEAMKDEAAVAVPWRVFGSSGHDRMPDGLVAERFVRRGPEDFSANRHVKSIVRPKAIAGVLNPHVFKLRPKRWLGRHLHTYVTPDGAPLQWLKPGKTEVAGGGEVARVHHYFTKSREHYEKKLQRGNADNLQARLDVFTYNDRNEVEDDSILTLYPDIFERIRQIL